MQGKRGILRRDPKQAGVKVVAIIGLVVAVLALLVAAGALGVALEERLTRSDRENELRAAVTGNARTPTLTIEHAGGEGPFAKSALTVPPGEFDGDNAICPKGAVVIAGGAAVSGPGLVLRSEAPAPDLWRAEIFNATDPLSTGAGERAP